MTIDVKTLLNAGVHFGHLTRKRHPNMTPYIFMEKNFQPFCYLHVDSSSVVIPNISMAPE